MIVFVIQWHNFPILNGTHQFVYTAIQLSLKLNDAKVKVENYEQFRHELHSIPRFPLRRASASLGLFCFSRANWSGLARNISLMMRGSSSTGGGLEAMDVPAAAGGTWILLKSKLAKPDGKAARDLSF